MRNHKALYFFSSFNSHCKFSPELISNLQSQVTNRERLVYICTDPEAHESTDNFEKLMTDYFRKMDIEFSEIHVLDSRKPANECTKLINSASVVFLMGGRTLLQYQFIIKNNLAESLKNHTGIIMGVSAGAINMAELSLLAPTESSGSVPVMYKGVSLADIPAIMYNGIGLADITTTPHFDPEDKNLIDNILLPFSHKTDIYAMEDDSAILIYDGKKQLFGNIHLISKYAHE